MNKLVFILSLIIQISFQSHCFSQVDIKEVDTTGVIFDPYVYSNPEFPGGQDSLNAFMGANIKWQQEKEWSGTVYVQFIVDTNGIIKDANILRGLGDGADREALRVFSIMPRWNPARDIYNKPVIWRMVLPIKFTLSDSQKHK